MYHGGYFRRSRSAHGIAFTYRTYHSCQGKVTYSVGFNTLLKSKQCFLATGVLWALSIACIKLSVLAFYVSIFRVPIFVASAYVIAALSISLMAAVVFTNLLICRPLSYNWDRSEKGSCGQTTALYLGSSIANLLIDVTIVVLPMPMLWSLQVLCICFSNESAESAD